MQKSLRLVTGVLLGAGLLYGMSMLSEVRQGSAPQLSQLRLAWRLVGQRAKVCRTLTAVEIAKLPLHMRKKEDCQERNFDYALRLVIDGHEVLTRTISPSGVRGDRPIFVQEDFPLLPGTYKVQVEFNPVDPDFLATLSEDQKAIVLEGMTKSVRYSFSEDINTTAGKIVLLSPDEVSGKLVQSKSKI